MRQTPALVFVALLALPACAAPEPAGFLGGGARDDDDPEGDGPHPLLGLEGGFSLRTTASDPPFACWGEGEERDDPASCNDAYLALAEALAGPVDSECIAATREALLAATELADAQGVEGPAAVDAASLASLVAAQLRPEDFASEEPVEVAAGPPRARDGYVELRLVFTHARLGAWPARLLIPDGPPAPTLVYAPGHYDSLDDTLTLRKGLRLVQEEGFAVLVPAFRAYNGAPVEADAALSLLCAGSSLLGAHVAELGVSRRFAEDLSALGLTEGALGVIGHSGGGINAVVSATLMPWDAVVFDGVSRWFLDVQRDGAFVQVKDEAHPGLSALAPCIYELQDTEFQHEQPSCERSGEPAHASAEYDYPAADWERVTAFLGQTMR